MTHSEFNHLLSSINSLSPEQMRQLRHELGLTMPSSPGTVSKILWHFTGGPRWNEVEKRQEATPKPVDDAHAALVGILSSRTLNLGSYQEVVPITVQELKSDGEGAYLEVLSPHTEKLTSVKVCCLADIPIGHLSYHAQRYGKFAIGFHRESAIKHEFSPVLYQLHDHFALRWLYYGFDGLKQCYAIDLPQIVQDLRDAFERAANNGNAPTEDMQSQLYEIEGRANVINYQMSKAWEGMNTLLAFVKSFTQDEFGTIYTEREWRSVKPFNFAYDDVSMIVLPRNAGNGDHYKRFVDQAESIGVPKTVSIVAWDDLVEH